MSPKTPDGWFKLLIGVLLVPAIGALISIVFLFSRMDAVEREVRSKPDTASVGELFRAMDATRGEMGQLRGDMRELRTLLMQR